MILQALVQRYETMLSLGQIAPPGWNSVPVSFGLDLSEDGSLVGLIPYRTEQQRGKKTVLAPQQMRLPAPVTRTVKVTANFLWDNAGYLLGISEQKSGQKRARECFEASRELHRELLRGADSPAARAVLAFFDHWKPLKASDNPVLSGSLKDIFGGNLTFCFRSRKVSDDPDVRKAWQAHYDGGSGEEESSMRCLVTGKLGPVAKIHPAIKRVKGAQPSGAALVSFNAQAYESYGREQGENAPVSKYAAFAYTSALNALLADSTHTKIVGDTTVVCWAEHGAANYQDAALDALFGAPPGMDDALLRAMLEKLGEGEPFDWQGTELNPEEHFYILGLAPNAARLSVRFFLRDSFGSFARNVRQHYRDIDVPRAANDRYAALPVWKLLGETVNQNSQDKACSPQLGGDVLRAILTGGPYPATLLSGAELRIRAEHEVTRGRAAIIKGYYTRFHGRQGHPHCPGEVLNMDGNTTNIPYTLGRLFSLYEQIQQAANPGINATIKDKYFNSAASTPAMIFPLLCNLAQKHLRKLTTGQKIYYEKQVNALSVLIGEEYPDRLDLPEQGSFQLGYYYQNLKRYESAGNKKEEIENV